MTLACFVVVGTGRRRGTRAEFSAGLVRVVVVAPGLRWITLFDVRHVVSFDPWIEAYVGIVKDREDTFVLCVETPMLESSIMVISTTPESAGCTMNLHLGQRLGFVDGT